MASQDNTIEKTAAQQVENLSGVENTKEAKLASQSEHETTLWQALKENKKAAFWSVMLSTTIIMEGYDVGKLALCDHHCRLSSL